MPSFPAELFRMEGDPGAVQASADAWTGFGADATAAAGDILRLDTSEFVGLEGDLFRARLTDEIPPDLEVTGEAFDAAGTALSTFAAALTGLQDRMRPLAARAPVLWQELQAALTAAAADPAAAPAAAQAQARWDECVAAATTLRAELVTTVDTAAADVDRAAGMTFAGTAFTGSVGAAGTLGAGGVGGTGDLGTASAETRTVVDAGDLLRGISLVAGVLSFFPPFTPIAGPIAIGTGLAAVAVDAVEYAETGEGDLTTIGVDAGLALLPGVGAVGRSAINALRPALRAPGLLRPGAAAAGGRATVRPDRATALDPVDVVSGEMLLTQTDVELPGLLPLVLERTHLSSYRVGGWFGRSWASTLDQRLEVDADGVCLATANGLLLAYPPAGDGPVLPAEGPRLPLARTADGYTVLDGDRTLHFGPVRPGPAEGVTTYLLGAVTDRNGHRLDVLRDAAGAPTAVHSSGGHRVAVETDTGRVVGLRLRGRTGPDRELARFGYDARGDLVEVLDPLGRPLRLGYDPVGRIVRWEDRNGEWYAYGYDVAGRVVRTSGSGGVLAGTIAYAPGRTVVTDSLGHATTYHVNALLQVERVLDPLGHTRTYEWDRYDRPVAATDPLGRTTRYTHDEAGNLVRLDRPDGTATTAAYDRARRPVRVTHPDGAQWTYTYDPAGNLATVTDPAAATTRYDHAPGGHLRAVTDPLGRTRRIDTDAAGLPVAVTDPLGAVTRWQRDDLGRIVGVVDPLGSRTSLEWTACGRLARRTGPDGATETWSWDAEGNLVEHVDPAGGRTAYEITHFDRTAARTGPDGARLEFGYDTELRLVSVTDPLGEVWRYEHDAAGRLVGETDFAGRTTAYELDPAGQLVVRTNAAGETVRLRRDPIGRVIERRSGDAVDTFEHDPAGRLVRAVNAAADVRLERDVLGRVVAETCDGRTVRSAYDLVGRRTARLTPTGAESRWDWDDAGRPAALHTAGRTVRFGHDAAGREVERRVDEALALTQTWDAAHRLESQTLSSGTRRLDHRADGMLLGVGADRFDLDPVGRVTAADGPDRTERYAYDRAGAPRAGGKVRYEHDAQGRVVLRQRRTLSGRPATWRYQWDADDRLVAVLTPTGDRWRYRYDALGRRVAKLRLAADGTPAERVDFSWDGLLLAERSSAGRTVRWDWEPGTFRPVTQVDEEFHAIVTDLVGTPTELVGPDGTVEWSARGTLWGAAAPGPCPLRFPGQYADPESGLHYNGVRHYDPETGRYASADPIGLAGGIDQHGYVGNPLTAMDPLGLAPCSPGGGFPMSGPPPARFTVDGSGTAVDRIGNHDAITLGRFPEYRWDAQAHGTRTFDIGDSWAPMTARTDRFGGTGMDSEVWYRNRAFLDDAADRGSEVRLASDPYDPRHAGSFFEREVAHLESRGYSTFPDRFDDGFRMFPGGS